MPATIEQKLKFRSLTADVFGLIEKEFTIVPKIPLMQSAHESNWGLSQLSQNDKNIFGMTPGRDWLRAMRKEIPMAKVKGWSKSGITTTYYPTTEYSKYPPTKIHWWDFPGDIRDKREDGKGGSILTVLRYFRRYDNWEESAWDWARKIAIDPLYRHAYEAAKAGAVVAYASAIQQAGYATDEHYASSLIDIASDIGTLP